MLIKPQSKLFSPAAPCSLHPSPYALRLKPYALSTCRALPRKAGPGGFIR